MLLESINTFSTNVFMIFTLDRMDINTSSLEQKRSENEKVEEYLCRDSHKKERLGILRGEIDFFKGF